MRIYIDSNTFPATPGLYADAAKTKPIPRMIPAVELQRGGFEVAFVGSNQPQDIASVSLVASIDGAGVQVVAEQGENVSDDSGDAWRFNFALNADSLVAEIAKRGSARLRVGVIVEDDTERREWQFNTVVYPSASSEEADTEAVESSKNFAELAQRAATQATAAQESVAGNAQLAESAKQTATQAANSAIEAADDAEVSERNAAESKDAAEQAKTDAESAKAAAQKAASDAQATLGNVYTKSQIDGVSTGAELTVAMNQAHEQLKSLRGEVPDNFYEALLCILEEWSLNPTSDWASVWDAIMEGIEVWRENPNGEVVISGLNSPWANKTSGAIVDFRQINVDQTGLSGSSESGGIIPPTFSGVAFFGTNGTLRHVAQNTKGKGSLTVTAPNARDVGFAFGRRYGSSDGGSVYRIIAPNALEIAYVFYVCVYAKEIYADLRGAVSGYGLFNNCTNVEKIVARIDSKPMLDSGSVSKLKKLTHARIYAPSLHSASGAFANSGLDAASICYTLDNLSADPVGRGGNGIITFTGCPGCAELTQDSPSVAAAVAKGWTVEL